MGGLKHCLMQYSEGIEKIVIPPPGVKSLFVGDAPGVHWAWSDAVDDWLCALRAAGRPNSTTYLRGYQIERVGRELAPLSPWEVTGPVLVAWAGGHDWSRETRRSFRSALRGFYGWAHAAGLIPVDPSLALPGVRPAEPNPRPCPNQAYRAALAAAGSDRRVWLILRLGAELGLRRGEIARVHADDLIASRYGADLLVHGKGEKTRLVPVPPGLAGVIRLEEPGYLFPGGDHGHLSAHYVGLLASRALPGAWTLHSLRHRFASVAFEIDRDLLTVQALLGHSSPVTTRRYVQIPSRRLRLTVESVSKM